MSYRNGPATLAGPPSIHGFRKLDDGVDHRCDQARRRVDRQRERGEPAPGAFLIVKDKDGKEVGNTNDGVSTVPTSNTASFFLAPGQYTVQAGETDKTSAGVPVPFDIKTGETQDLKIKVGAAK